MKRVVTFCTSSLICLALATAASGQVRYTVTDLGSVLGAQESNATGINNSGQIVGSFGINRRSSPTAFVYSGGTAQAINMLPGYTYESAATAINCSGQIVGLDENSSGAEHSFLYSGGAVQDIGVLTGGQVCQAQALNDSGEVVGEANIGNGNYDAFSYSNGRINDLGTFGGPWANALGVNDSGQIVGASEGNNTDGSSFEDAFLYSNGAMRDLNTLIGTSSATWTLQFASAINNQGQIVGFGFDSGQAAGFLYSNGMVVDLGTLPGFTYSIMPLCINNNGQVVGEAGNGSGSHAFLYYDGTMQDLNSLIDPASGWMLQSAAGINDSGEIVGVGTDPVGNSEGFLLTPTPEPHSAALLLAGAFCLLAFARRRRISR